MEQRLFDVMSCLILSGLSKFNANVGADGYILESRFMRDSMNSRSAQRNQTLLHTLSRSEGRKAIRDGGKKKRLICLPSRLVTGLPNLLSGITCPDKSLNLLDSEN